MLDYPSEVDKIFLELHSDKNLTSAQKMNLRYDAAKSLLARRYSHLTSELEKKLDNQYKADLNQWNLVLDDVSLAEDVSQ